MDKFIGKNIIMMLIVAAVLLAAGLIATDEAFAATTGTVSSPDGLNVRTGPGTEYSYAMSALSYGTTFTVVSSENDKNGDKWYKIYINGQYGYVFAEYVTVKDDPVYTPDADFEKYMTDQGFPESYKDYLRTLHAVYPGWVFKAQKTGIDWSSAVAKESIVGRNLVHKSSPESWKSKEYGAYNPDTGEYVIFDSGGWVSASEGIIKYYMDPRNFIDQNGIFQFMAHSFDAATQTRDGIEKQVAGTFLANKFPEAGYDRYSDMLLHAGSEAGANPYVLASMILVEQGRDGRGNSISGKVSGYEGLYNFFNVGAVAGGGRDAVENGLIYARSVGWNSRAKSIIGGAVNYAQYYIKNRQDTLYLKKFNVMNGLNSVATHQYMTNVAGASQEASELKNGYSGSNPVTFFIPVYNNMPDVTCSKPDGGNNDYFLKSLEVAGYDLMPVFNMYTSEYEIIVPSGTTYVSINAVARDSGAKTAGTGKVNLTGNVTKATITVTATSGAQKKYNITIAKETVTDVTPTSPVYKIGEYVTGVQLKTSVIAFKSNIKAPEGHTLKIVNRAGSEVTSGDVGTGMNLLVMNGSKAVKSIPVLIKGDNSGDGKCNSLDLLYIQKHIVKLNPLSGADFKASDINGDGKVNSLDLLYVQKHIVGLYTIEN